MDTVALPDLNIKTDTFEGPLELLIELVEKRKLLINNISLASVTDEYLARVSAMQEQSLPNTAQFINLAATLLLIKSKSLLPNLDLSSEEEASIDDLEERLRIYQVYREAGEEMQKIFGVGIMYDPEYRPPREKLFLPDLFCDLSKLQQALERVITDLPKETVKPKAKVKPAISLEEMMDNLKHRIERQYKFSFFQIKNAEKEHKTIIVGFLAILELFKQGNILITQQNRFSDIEVERENSTTPQYY